MVLVRHVSHYIINYYLPSGLFVVVSWISFLVPSEIIPGKDGYRGVGRGGNAQNITFTGFLNLLILQLKQRKKTGDFHIFNPINQCTFCCFLNKRQGAYQIFIIELNFFRNYRVPKNVSFFAFS